MVKSTRDGTVQTMGRIAECLRDRKSVRVLEKEINALLLSKQPWMDEWGRREVSRACRETFLKGLIIHQSLIGFDGRIARLCDNIMKAFNRAFRHTWALTKRTAVLSQMKLQRGRSDEPRVFYLVSKHQKSQKAHEPLQGKVLIDPAWRTVLEGHQDKPRVASYVRRHKTISVAKAMREPYYLIVRPYCKHFLIPLETHAVLVMSEKGLNGLYQARPAHVHRPLTPQQMRKQYLEMRNAVMATVRKVFAEENKAGA